VKEQDSYDWFSLGWLRLECMQNVTSGRGRLTAVPAGGDQEQVKACPPTKGRLSRDLPNLTTRTLAKLARANELYFVRFTTFRIPVYKTVCSGTPPLRLRGFFAEYERSLQSRKADL
jgi:hypothetical protein